MASHFGEIVFPTSRAFWDDEDENGPSGNTQNEIEFSLKWIKEKPERIKTLVVIEGDMLIDFTRECLCQDAEEICVIQDDQQKKVLVICKINDEIHFCMISPHFDIKYSGKIIDKVSDILVSSENLIAITCYHISQFKSTNIPCTPSFLRMLTSKTGKDMCKFECPLLERPNIVFGVAAGVLSYAEFMNKSSVLYILYTDCFTLDSLSAGPLIKLFSSLNCTPHNISLVADKFFNKGNLYM